MEVEHKMSTMEIELTELLIQIFKAHGWEVENLPSIYDSSQTPVENQEWDFDRFLGVYEQTNGTWCDVGKVILYPKNIEKVAKAYVGGQDDTAIGRNEGKKKIVVLAVERKSKGVSRIYARVIPTASKKNLQEFMVEHISPNAFVRTDKWSGYCGLEKQFPNLIREKSEKKGKNFSELHRTFMMFKAWLRGVHHSVRKLLPYLDEYTYRFNRHTMKEGIFENLMQRMVKSEPLQYKIMLIN